MSTTFEWGGVDIKSEAPAGSEIRITNIYRPMIYPTRRRKIKIPGRDGSWDFGGSIKDDYTVTVDIAITADTALLAQECAEVIAAFLVGKDDLEFSDSPTVHTAQVYDMVASNPEGRSNIIRANVTFECEAISPKENTDNLTALVFKTYTNAEGDAGEATPTLQPSFAAAVYDYGVTVASNAESCRITPTRAGAQYTLYVNNDVVATATPSNPYLISDVGVHSVVVSVTESGKKAIIYKITIVKPA